MRCAYVSVMEPVLKDGQCTYPAASLEIGSQLGPDLTIQGVLGEGGTAVVYSAYHAVLRREVAIKVSTLGSNHTNEAHSRLIREAKMCASVRDPHVPRVYGLDQLSDG